MQRDKIDLIIFSLSRHDSFISSPSFSLAKEFAKHNRVFYIDHPYSLKDLVGERKTTQLKSRLGTLFTGKNRYRKPTGQDNLTVVIPGLTLPVNFFPEGVLYDALSSVNDAILFRTIRRIIRDFGVQKFVYANFFDPYFGIHFPNDLQPLKKIYQSMDDLSQVPYTAKHGIRMEREMMRTYDDTFVTSRELYRIHEPYARKIHYHPNAADLTIFSKALDATLERPEEIKALAKPLIGYTGNIDERPDYELLRKIADDNKDKYLVMVGPVNTQEHISAGLNALDNVIFIGPKKIEQLPAFLKHFSCTIIPFKRNVLTRSIYPLKINEYLAAGKPVVAMNFSEDIASFRPEAYIADSHDEFLQLIKTAMQEDNETRRRERIEKAAKNTWQNRVAEFWEAIGL